MAASPNPEFLGDYQTPTNVMVTFPSGMVLQDLGDCQAVPFMGRNGRQEASISLHAIRFICKEHTWVLFSVDAGRIPKQQPHCSQIQIRLSSMKYVKKHLVSHGNAYCHLPFQRLARLHRRANSRLSYQANRNPLGCSLTNAFFSSTRKKKGYFELKSIPRLYSSPNDASSQTGTTWEVARESKQAAESSFAWCATQ